MEVKGANLRGGSSTNTQSETIFENLKKAAQFGDIQRLYNLIAEDPNILGHFDEVPFCETPLHIAAEKGQTHFAMELMNLKPSLASKLNVSGFSPMHLALQNNHIRMVRGFVAIDSSLVRIKGRGMITPLHHLAEIGDAKLLSEFLIACPSSVEDLTIKCETAVHVAVKNQHVMTFKVLLGWLKRVNKKEILDWKDEDGNTVFHIAAFIKQTEVIKLLRKTVKINAKNLDGKTAMDLLHSNHNQPPFITMTLAEYLSENISFLEKRNNLLGLSNLSLSGERSVNTSNRRDAILVVAILIVTATYQAGLSPPGGYWQETTKDALALKGHRAGQMTMSFNDAFFFLLLNGVAFLSSMYVIITLTVGLPMWRLIYGAMAALSTAMVASNKFIIPNPHHNRSVLSILAFPMIIGSMLIATFYAFIVHKKRLNQVDFPASCFRRSDAHTVSLYFLCFGTCFASGVYFGFST